MDYSWFEQQFLLMTGIDLRLYKEKQMKRRIGTLIERCQKTSYQEFLTLLQEDKAAFENFKDYITINVTEFFRTQEQWRAMEEVVLPHLHQPLIWSTACSTGEEPYSLVMALAKYMPLSDIHVIATDINQRVLDIAQKGFYHGYEFEKVPQDIRDRFFTRADDGYQICDAVKQCAEFRQLNLLQDSFPHDCDMIVCRNVLIYFTDEAKNKLFSQFHDSLKPGGYLFTGNTEQLIHYKDFDYEKISNFLYRKRDG